MLPYSMSFILACHTDKWTTLEGIQLAGETVFCDKFSNIYFISNKNSIKMDRTQYITWTVYLAHTHFFFLDGNSKCIHIYIVLLIYTWHTVQIIYICRQWGKIIIFCYVPFFCAFLWCWCVFFFLDSDSWFFMLN